MKSITLSLTLLTLAIGLIFHQPVEAQFAVRNSTFGNGGGIVGNSSFRIASTVGQPGVGETSGASFVASTGFAPIQERFAAKIGIATPSGSNVAVQPLDSTTGTNPATVTFSTVTEDGTTSLRTVTAGPPPPQGFGLGFPPTYYDLTTTAAFSGAVGVCINYTGVSFVGSESSLKLYHYENGTWVNRTASLNTANNIICASVTFLSPFVIVEPENQPLVANAGADQSVECTSQTGTPVTLDGSGSTDSDGDALTYTWRENSTIIAGPTSSPTSTVTLNLGSHTIELTVDDGNGGTDTDEVIITVGDTTPPTLTVTLSPNSLWPPNHQLVDIQATVTVSDACDAKPTLVLTSIVSNEPDNGLGDGDTPNDIQDADFGTADVTFKLRAERSGTGNGRVYTVTYTATDASGNSVTVSATVSVPKSQKKGVGPAFPNPANPEVWIPYQLDSPSEVVIRIYDVTGRLVRELEVGHQAAGFYDSKAKAAHWDGRNTRGETVASGVYFYTFQAGDFTATRKLLIAR